MCETWKQIDGFDNYEVSDHGRIRNKTTNNLPKAYDSGGRMSVTLYNSSRQRFGKRLHNLVAQAFVPNPERKECVHNMNCDVTNCRADNLFWVSELERTQQWAHQLNRSKPHY